MLPLSKFKHKATDPVTEEKMRFKLDMMDLNNRDHAKQVHTLILDSCYCDKLWKSAMLLISKQVNGRFNMYQQDPRIGMDDYDYDYDDKEEEDVQTLVEIGWFLNGYQYFSIDSISVEVNEEYGSLKLKNKEGTYGISLYLEEYEDVDYEDRVFKLSLEWYGTVRRNGPQIVNAFMRIYKHQYEDDEIRDYSLKFHYENLLTTLLLPEPCNEVVTFTNKTYHYKYNECYFEIFTYLNSDACSVESRYSSQPIELWDRRITYGIHVWLYDDWEKIIHCAKHTETVDTMCEVIEDTDTLSYDPFQSMSDEEVKGMADQVRAFLEPYEGKMDPDQEGVASCVECLDDTYRNGRFTKSKERPKIGIYGDLDNTHEGEADHMTMMEIGWFLNGYEKFDLNGIEVYYEMIDPYRAYQGSMMILKKGQYKIEVIYPRVELTHNDVKAKYSAEYTWSGGPRLNGPYRLTCDIVYTGLYENRYKISLYYSNMRAKISVPEPVKGVVETTLKIYSWEGDTYSVSYAIKGMTHKIDSKGFVFSCYKQQPLCDPYHEWRREDRNSEIIHTKGLRT